MPTTRGDAASASRGPTAAHRKLGVQRVCARRPSGRRATSACRHSALRHAVHRTDAPTALWYASSMYSPQYCATVATGGARVADRVGLRCQTCAVSRQRVPVIEFAVHVPLRGRTSSEHLRSSAPQLNRTPTSRKSVALGRGRVAAFGACACGARAPQHAAHTAMAQVYTGPR